MRVTCGEVCAAAVGLNLAFFICGDKQWMSFVGLAAAAAAFCLHHITERMS